MNTQLKRIVVVLASSAALVLPVSTAAHAAPSDAKPQAAKIVKADSGSASTQRIDWE